MTTLISADHGPHGAYSGWNDTVAVLGGDGVCRELNIPRGVFGDRAPRAKVIDRPEGAEPRKLSAKWLAVYGKYLPLDSEDEAAIAGLSLKGEGE